MPVAAEHAGGGPVYFALVDPTETAFTEDHIRYDEYVLKLEIDLEEGKIPVATIDMINPGVSWWLDPARKRWVWIAFDDGSEVKPAFFGRILALPSDMFGEIVTVKFYAKPLDYLARKQAAADALKVLPNYDKVFIDPTYIDDPDTVLEGYSGVWHFDPVTHAVSLNDYIIGAAGELDFAADEIIYDSLTFILGDPPPRAIKVDAVVTYTQRASGGIGLFGLNFSSTAGQKLHDDWPIAGTSIGGGWSVKTASMQDDLSTANATVPHSEFHWKNGDKVHANGDFLSVDETLDGPPGNWANYANIIGQITNSKVTIGDPETGQAASIQIQSTATAVLRWQLSASLELSYEASRERTEHLMFTLALDSQAMLSDDDGSDDIETLTLSGGDVGQPLPGESEPPIVDVSRRSYFPTDRGLQSVAYVLNVARADLLSKARPAEIGFQSTTFSQALGVTLRHTARVHDARRLPGGEAAGKVVNVKINAEFGNFSGTVMLKGAIGRGGTVEVVDGEPTIVDADVLGSNVQLFAGQALVLATSDCGYSRPVDGINDDGLSFPLSEGAAVIRAETIQVDDPDAALSAITLPLLNGNPNAAREWAEYQEALKQAALAALKPLNYSFELELRPVADLAFEYSFDITAGPLLYAAQVDLGGS